MRLIVVRRARKRSERAAACGVITTVGQLGVKGGIVVIGSLASRLRASMMLLARSLTMSSVLSSARAGGSLPHSGTVSSSVSGLEAVWKLVYAASRLGGLVSGTRSGKMWRFGGVLSFVTGSRSGAMERLGVMPSWASSVVAGMRGPTMVFPVFHLPDRFGSVESVRPSFIHLTEKVQCDVWPVMQARHFGSALCWSSMVSSWAGQVTTAACDVWPVFSVECTWGALHGHEAPWIGSGSARMGDYQLFQEYMPLYNLLEITGGNLMLLGLAVTGAAMQLPRLRVAMLRFIAVGYANPLYYIRDRLLPVIRCDVARSVLGNLVEMVYDRSVKETRLVFLAPPVFGYRESWVVHRATPLNVLLTTVGRYVRDAVLVSGLLSGAYSASMFEATAEDLWSEWWERNLGAMIAALGIETVAAVRGVYNVADVDVVKVNERVRRFVKEVVVHQPHAVRRVVEEGYRAVDLSRIVESAVKYSYAYRRLLAAGLLVFAAYAELARGAETRTFIEAIAEYGKLLKRKTSITEVLLSRAKAGTPVERVAADMAMVVASTIPAVSSLVQCEVLQRARIDPTPASFIRSMSELLERFSGIAIGFSMAVAKALELLGIEDSVNVYWMFYELTARSLGVETRDVVGAVIGKLLPGELVDFFRKVVLAESPYVDFLSVLLTTIPYARAGARWLSEFVSGLKKVMKVGGSPVPLPGTVLGQFLLEMRRKLVTEFIVGSKREVDRAIQKMIHPFTTAPTCPLVDPEVMEMVEWLVFRGGWIGR